MLSNFNASSVTVFPAHRQSSREPTPTIGGLAVLFTHSLPVEMKYQVQFNVFNDQRFLTSLLSLSHAEFSDPNPSLIIKQRSGTRESWLGTSESLTPILKHGRKSQYSVSS
jgi:hypothetical protein